MLTPRQIEIVKSTVPVLQQHGETITRTFYRNLFEENPGLKDIFNMANQAKGDQARSLAASVLAYAANIDELQNLGPAVSLIAHKHCSLDVAAEHYPIVGRNLLRAIGEVLGDAITPEIGDAWTAAYAQLAEIFIGVEGGMYKENAGRGWTGFKPFTVTNKVAESSVITSFTLEPVDGKPLAAHLPGQYLSVKVTGVGPNVEMRQYTISSSPNEKSYRISVKREPGGLVSNYLHDEVQIGDEVLVHMPQGDFILDEKGDGPIVLLSGGVGITPILAMLEQIASTSSERPVTFVHAAIDGSVHAFGKRVREIVEENPNISAIFVYETPRSEDVRGLHYDFAGRLNRDLLSTLVDGSADCYICGPTGFMFAVEDLLEDLEIPAERRKKEVFGPTLGLKVPALA